MGFLCKEILEDFAHPHVSASPLDIYLPALGLALEFHGLQHYISVSAAQQQHQTVSKEKAKRDQCQKAGIALVIIPFWWNRKEASLVATIRELRPDLLQDYPIRAEPISQTPPSNLLHAISRSKRIKS